MQHFINHAAIERAAAEVFSSTRARVYMFAAIALSVGAAAGMALGAIWLGVALLIEEARRVLAARLSPPITTQAKAVHLALDLTSAASLAAAPAIAWSVRADIGAALAVGMLCVLLTNAAYSARRGRLYTLATCAPYGLLGIAILAESAATGMLLGALMCGAAIIYVFTAAMHHTHRAAHARLQDAEWVRQLNMSFGDTMSAAWEIDFARRRLVGAQRLSTLIGRDVSYSDVVERACFAPPEDFALVKAAFSPSHGAGRQIAIEHDAVQADGSRLRIRHQGFVRTTPDGAPVRITLITRHSEMDVTPSLSDDVAKDAAAALSSQFDALKTLNNELAMRGQTNTSTADLSSGLAQIMRTLAERGAAVERGVDDLAHARHSAEAANLAKSQFLANMSHELRTPLNAILGYAEMLQEDAQDAGDDATAQDLTRILTAAKHLLSLLNEILDLSKIEAGRMDVSTAEFDPIEMLEDLVDTMRPLAVQNNNTIDIVSKVADAPAATDAMKLRQCVLNLLSNASKFTKDGKIDIEFDRRMYNGVEQLFITVRDTGIGMTKEHVSRLFQPFVQADPSITQQYGGTGLGLTITRRLAQLLGGDVSVKSAFGGGSAFTLHVPANFADASAALGAAAKVDEVQGSADAPLVIVIEDEPDARELAARALTRAGFAVQGVGGGEAGLALARAKAPALVLLDIFLPDRSGWRVLQSLKHDPKTQDIPVVVLSVNEDRAHAMSLGAAEHMVKPADRDVLAATVMRYARKRPDLAAAITAPSSARKQTG